MPHGLWPSPDGRRLYVGLENGDAVQVVDTATQRITATIPVGQLPQAVRVLLHRQVQRSIGGIQVGVAAATVGQPGHRHLAEHRGQRAGMPGLDGTAGHLPGVGHLGQALLALRPQLQVILHQDSSVPLVAVNMWYHVGSGD